MKRTNPAPIALVFSALCCLTLAAIGWGRAGDTTNTADHLLHVLHDAQSKRVMVVAHRGDWREHPENSLAAFRSAIEMGVDIIEIDVRRTSDGAFVVIHDKTLDRTTTGSGKVKDHTLEQVRRLKLRNAYGVETDHQVPTLRQVLGLAKGRVLVYIDKSEHVIPEVHRVTVGAGMEDYVFYYGRHTLPELREALGPLYGKVGYLPKIGDATPDPMAYVTQFEQAIAPPAFIVDFASEDSKVLGVIKYLRQRDTRVWASPLWPQMAAGRTDDRAVEDPDGNWGWLIEHGVSMICTDRPKRLLDYLRERGQHD